MAYYFLYDTNAAQFCTCCIFPDKFIAREISFFTLYLKS